MAESIVALIEFGESHYQTWIDNQADIGLDASTANDYKAATLAARQSYQAVAAAKLQLKALVLAQTQAIRTLRTQNSNAIRSIRAFAQSSDDPDSVYQRAQIPAPAAPGPVRAPNPAFDLTADLALLDGGIIIRWKASQPSGVSGVVYKLERATTPAGPWSTVGLTGSKNAIDTTIPVGTSAVLYRVVAQRGSLQSATSESLSIRFGTGPGAIDLSTLQAAA